MQTPDKTAVLAAFHAHLQAAIEALQRGRDDARAGTRVDGTHRPENRGERAAVTTQGYLTAGLAARAAELEEHLRALELIDPGPRDRITPGALVRLEDIGWTAVLPGGQGAKLRVDGVQITVLSPDSPLGQALRGAEEGDEVPMRGTEVAVGVIR